MLVEIFSFIISLENSEMLYLEEFLLVKLNDNISHIITSNCYSVLFIHFYFQFLLPLFSFKSHHNQLSLVVLNNNNNNNNI
jgi:hypothetical protein